MQVYLGSYYINDFNQFGRTFRVIAQADQRYRGRHDDVLLLKTRNADGETVLLGSILSLKESFGANMATRYNGYPRADINGRSEECRGGKGWCRTGESGWPTQK